MYVFLTFANKRRVSLPLVHLLGPREKRAFPLDVSADGAATVYSHHIPAIRCLSSGEDIVAVLVAVVPMSVLLVLVDVVAVRGRRPFRCLKSRESLGVIISIR